MSPPNPSPCSSASVPAGPPPGDKELAPAHLAALVQMAGGIAPALSDLLTVIRGQAGRLLEADAPNADNQSALQQIFNAAERAGSLVRQLMIFSGQQAIQARALDLNRCIEEHSAVLRSLAGAGVAVEFKLAANLPPVLADADLIEQTLLVLVQNAHDALPQGGRMLIRTAAAEPAGEPGRPAEDKPIRSGVLLEVADNGPGIAPEIRPRLFEPFFTTKAGGGSAGLGLATVFGIVRQHGGRITVESAVDGGSSFKVFLPAVTAGAVVSDPMIAAGRSVFPSILLVEDDEAVRDFTATLLTEQGYRVLQAAGAVDALEVWQWHRERIGLLLTDMVLGDNLTGLELAAQLRIDRPDLPVICTSGYRNDTMRSFPGIDGGYRYLAKPCRPQVLLSAVRDLLGQPVT